MTDPIVQAAAEVLAIVPEEIRVYWDEAAAVVAAVTPLIRAQIADQIAARKTSNNNAELGYFNAGIALAEDIARGTSGEV